MHLQRILLAAMCTIKGDTGSEKLPSQWGLREGPSKARHSKDKVGTTEAGSIKKVLRRVNST